MKLNAKLSLMNESLGWGDDAAQVWFIGIEESNIWDEKTFEKLPARRRPFDRVISSAKDDQINRFCSNVCLVLGGTRIPSVLDRARFIANHLWRDGSGTCHANLKPLGKPRTTAWPSNYSKHFESRQTYETWVIQTRYPYISESFFASRHAKVAFCFGIPGDFKNAFNLSPPADYTISFKCGPKGRNSKAEFFLIRNKILALTPFLGNGQMSYPFTQKIGSALADRFGIKLVMPTISELGKFGA